MRTLDRLPRAHGGCLIVAADTLLQRLPPREYVQGRTFELAVGDRLALETFRSRLIEAGYASVSQVGGPGEFAVRGSLLDVFPMGAEEPLRIDLFDDEIEALRRFDPETQRSLDSIERIRLLPAREVPLDPEAVKGFRRRYRMRFEGDPMQSAVYRGVSEGIAPAGVEFYLPLFFDATATLFDYLPPNAVIVHEAGATAELDRARRDIETRYEDRRHDIERPVVAPRELFLDPLELAERAAGFASVAIDGESDAASGASAHIAATPSAAGRPGGAAAAGETVHALPTIPPRELKIDPRAEHPLAPLEAFLEELGGRVLIGADSPGRREVLHEMLSARFPDLALVADWNAFAAGGPALALALTVAPDVDGLQLTHPPVAFLSESQLFGARARQERRRRRTTADPAAILRDLMDLAPGAPVVHEEYGVGRYVGLTPMEIAGQQGEFLVLEYQDGDRVYVPVHALHLVSRYTGAAPE
ncbi:MAG: CarD family transcriptional regulator, partial [Steroidobacteraceae bacterium]